MSSKPPVTAAVIRFTTLALTLPAACAISPWATLAISAWWLLPDWIGKWLDVRDRWQSPPP